MARREQIIVEVTDRGTRVVSRNLAGIGQSAAGAESSVQLLRRTLGLLTAGLGISALVKLADTYTTVENRLRLVTKSTQELVTVQSRLFDIAQQTRTAFEDNAELYNRLALSGRELGLTQNQLLGITKSINQAIVISGATGAEASAGLIQFSQGLASGALRGDELRSVLEQLPKLADVIAQEFGVGRGELRKLGEEGKLTADRIISALQRAAPQLEAEFGKITPTISSAFTVLRNAVIKYVGEADKGIGISSVFVSGITALAENIDLAAAAILTLGVAMAATFTVELVSRIGDTVKGVNALTLALARNPLGLLAVALATVIGALTIFRDEISAVSDGAATLGDLLRAIGEAASSAFGSLATLLRDLVGPALDQVSEFLSGIDVSLEDVLLALNRGVDRIIGAYIGLGKAIAVVLKRAMDAAKAIIVEGINFIITRVETAINAIVSAANRLPGLQLDAVELPRLMSQAADTGQDLGAAVREAFAEGLNFNYFEQGLQNLFNRAREIGRLRTATGAGPADLNAPGNRINRPTPLTKEEENQFDAFLKKADPVAAAQREIAQAQELVNKATAAGLVTRQRGNELMETFRFQLRDALDPLGAVNRELTQQEALMRLDSAAREVSNQLYQIEQDLLRQNIKLTEDQRAALERRLKALQETEKAMRAQEELLRSIRGPQEDFLLKTKALDQLLKDGKISLEEYNQKLRELRIELLETGTSASEGLERGLLKVQTDLNDLASLVEDTVIGAFRSLEDQLVQLARTGKFNFSDLVDSILNDLARLAVRQTITKPLFDLISGGLGSFGGLGGFGGARAGGGAVSPGSSYLVNENRVESSSAPGLFFPLGPGRIDPRGGGQGGVTIVNNMTVNVTAPDGKIDDETMRRLAYAAEKSQEQSTAKALQQARRSGNVMG